MVDGDGLVWEEALKGRYGDALEMVGGDALEMVRKDALTVKMP